MEQINIEHFPFFVRNVQSYRQRRNEFEEGCIFLVSVKQILFLCVVAFLIGIFFPTVIVSWTSVSQDGQQQTINNTQKNNNNIFEASRRKHGDTLKSSSPRIAWRK
jgi:hypothetical protein